MRVLMVGAGAVGQVFGHFLKLGGAEVAVYVKPKYADEARAGFTLYDQGRGDEQVHFQPDGVFTSAEDVQGQAFDMVFLAMSSTGLRGAWLEELTKSLPEATFVGLQPGLGDPELVRGFAGADRVVWGIIELIAYQSPLPGGQGPGPGVAFWIPRLLVFPFSGPQARTEAVVAAFKAGGLRAWKVEDTERTTAVGSPVMNLHMAALEAAGWSFAAIREDRELLALTNRAARQAVAIAAHELGTTAPLWTRLIRPWQIRLLSRLAPRVMPMDAEVYLQFHFTKVGDQTRAHLERWVRIATEANLPHDAIVGLRDRLDRAQVQARVA